LWQFQNAEISASMYNLVGKSLCNIGGKGNEYAYDQLNAYQHIV
jgi:hypothetical protein